MALGERPDITTVAAFKQALTDHSGTGKPVN
jgi:hypothetical protein